jgi:hypothetical protein
LLPKTDSAFRQRVIEAVGYGLAVLIENSRSVSMTTRVTALAGTNQEGKRSVRCTDNTGPRQHIITEFDSGSLDEQAALLLYLATLLPLILVVLGIVSVCFRSTRRTLGPQAN